MLKYPYYDQDPSLRLSVVQTVHGTTEYLQNCKKINGSYYIKGKDLDFIGDQWILREKIVYDWELKKNVANTPGLLHGIVEIDSNGNETLGYFTPNVYKNCTVFGRERNKNCIDADILKPPFYMERISEGKYYDSRHFSAKEKNIMGVKEIRINNANHVYNAEDNPKLFEHMIELYNGSNFPIEPEMKYLSNYIKDITFGVELETINGILPQHLINKHGIIICKDGSIKDRDGRYPPEYVTVPLSGAKGLQNLKNLSQEISKRSEIDIKCSYHVHIGGMDISRVFMVSLFKLCVKIQNDVFKMFPYYKTKPDGIKEKNYCKKLPDSLSTFGTKNFNDYINATYADIYTFLSGGQRLEDNGGRKAKINPWGGEKWNIKTRYYWVNFVNPLFGKRDTIEFRIHTPTLNPDKIINWLMMCVAIIKYAENNTKECISSDKITFEEVLGVYKGLRSTSYAATLSNRLIDYYRDRVNYFKRDLDRGDFISEAEIRDDNNYKFNISKLQQ